MAGDPKLTKWLRKTTRFSRPLVKVEFHYETLEENKYQGNQSSSKLRGFHVTSPSSLLQERSWNTFTVWVSSYSFTLPPLLSFFLFLFVILPLLPCISCIPPYIIPLSLPSCLLPLLIFSITLACSPFPMTPTYYLHDTSTLPCLFYRCTIACM